MKTRGFHSLAIMAALAPRALALRSARYVPPVRSVHRGDGYDVAYQEAAERKRVRRQARRALEVHGVFYAIAA